MENKKWIIGLIVESVVAIFCVVLAWLLGNSSGIANTAIYYNNNVVSSEEFARIIDEKNKLENEKQKLQSVVAENVLKIDSLTKELEEVKMQSKEIEAKLQEDTNLDSTQRDGIKNEESINLSDVDYLNQQVGCIEHSFSDLVSGEGLKDNIGEMHNRCIYLSYCYNDIMYREYYINKKYSHFNATLAIPFKTRSMKTNVYLTIYGDDEIIYTSKSMTGGDIPIPISDLDISGYDILRFEFINDGKGAIGLYDATLK